MAATRTGLIGQNPAASVNWLRRSPAQPINMVKEARLIVGSYLSLEKGEWYWVEVRWWQVASKLKSTPRVFKPGKSCGLVLGGHCMWATELGESAGGWVGRSKT